MNPVHEGLIPTPGLSGGKILELLSAAHRTSRAIIGTMPESFWRSQVIEPALDEDTERQIAAQKAWIAAEPSNPRPYWQLATLVRMQGKREFALGLLLQAVHVDSGFGPGHATLAEVYAVSGDSRAAWRHARLAERAGIVEAVEMLARHGVPEEATGGRESG